MGRHRRSAAGRATGFIRTPGSAPGNHDPLDSYPGDRPAGGVAPHLNPEAYTGTRPGDGTRLFAADGDRGRPPAGGTAASPNRALPGAAVGDDGFAPDGGSRRAGAHRRRKKAAAPVRTGLLGVSAAVALGTVAVSTGLVPGLDSYELGGGSGAADGVQAQDSPTGPPTERGGASGGAGGTEDAGGAGGRGGTSAGRGPGSSASPSASPTAPSATPAETPSQKPKTPSTPSGEQPATTPAPPARKVTEAPEQSGAPAAASAESAAEAQVLRLVNEERAKAGCSPVTASGALAELAGDFSDAMAEQGFFDHTDPSGATPWDRAERAGISNLGGENIARGQTDAAAVMEAWMNSAGHRANILNCDFRTLGVGVHFGAGGPWWTQDFGY
ncbi:CAP domain-containing protein [Streptomyces sp. NPDC051041]|uniref:CAP domain-containing protein n=1 Tax=Streptomyces sp. NPDC051041 TaxID=3365640 RepID=UPI0037A36206